MKTKIAILGGGNLGSALAQGLARTDDASSAYQVTVTRRNTGLIRHLEDEGITVTSDNIATTEQADQSIIAVQPTQVETLINKTKPAQDADKHIIDSTMAGVSSNQIAKLTGPGCAILRIMPNTAAAINESMTCIEQTPHKEAEEKTVALFETLGKTLVINSELMEASTVLGA